MDVDGYVGVYWLVVLLLWGHQSFQTVGIHLYHINLHNMFQMEGLFQLSYGERHATPWMDNQSHRANTEWQTTSGCDDQFIGTNMYVLLMSYNNQKFKKGWQLSKIWSFVKHHLLCINQVLCSRLAGSYITWSWHYFHMYFQTCLNKVLHQILSSYLDNLTCSFLNQELFENEADLMLIYLIIPK